MKDKTWKLTINDVREKDWPTIKKKLYFRCNYCGEKRVFQIEGNTISVPKNCVKCGYSEVSMPTEISIGWGPLAQVLMIGQSLSWDAGKGPLPLNHKEIHLTLE